MIKEYNQSIKYIYIYIYMYAYRMTKNFICKKEETTCSNIIKQLGTNVDDISRENIKKHNPNWQQIPDYPYRIVTAGGSWDRKTYELPDLITQQTFVGLQDVLEDGKLLRWRRLQDVLKTCLEHVLKAPWGHVLMTSSRRFGDKQNVYWVYLCLTNRNVYLTNVISQIHIWQI